MGAMAPINLIKSTSELKIETGDMMNFKPTFF
jgi:hypothetical protein